MNMSEVPGLSALMSAEGSLNMNGFGNQDIEDKLKRINTTSDETELKKLYSEIQMYIVNRLPILGLLFRTGTVLSSRPLGGMSGLRYYDAFNGFEFIQ